MSYGRISKKQQEILDYIKNEILNRGFPPAVREICEAVNLKSTSSVHSHLEALEKNGYIRRDATKPRAIEIIDDNFNLVRREVVNVPLVGTVAAGQPILAVENIEGYFPVPAEYMPNAQSFMLKVKGDSMINAGIFDGDQVLVKQQASASNGDIVVALVEDSATVKTLTDVKVYNVDQLLSMQDKIDVLVLCGGSATDLPKQTAEYAKYFNVVDSFDTHAKIPEHFAQVDAAAKEGGRVAMISVGWDPGMFSLNRLYANAILRDGSDYTFWGKGVSQGHSDAIRRIPGVKDAKQYTIPVESALEAVRNCENPVLTTRQKHTRECFVVAEEGADKAQIEEQIKTMPNYFADYDTTVHFITEEELQRDHAGIPHGGFVLRTGKTGLNGEHNHVIEYSLKLDSNPEFTSCVLTAYARAAYRMNQEGQKGCKTVFDVAPAYLSTLTPEEMRSALL